MMMGEGRSRQVLQQQPSPPPPSPATLSVVVEPAYAPYYYHHQQQKQEQCCNDGDGDDDGRRYQQQQIDIPNGFAACGAPATPYPGHPRRMVDVSPPVVTTHLPAGGEKAPDVDQLLPCCGIGIGWFLFILGFFFVLPWYVGVGFLLCSKYDNREKPGYIACAVLAVIFLVLAVVDATRPVYGQV